MPRGLSLTYAPKIEAVFNGSCRQTLRFSRNFKEGEKRTIHDWAGVPYRSPWGRRLDVEITRVRLVKVDTKAIAVYGWGGESWMSFPWDSIGAMNLARADGIVARPGDNRILGLVWRDVLIELNKTSRTPVDLERGAEGSIIEWEPIGGVY